MKIHDAVMARVTQAEGVKKTCKLGDLIESLEPADRDAVDYAIKRIRAARMGTSAPDNLFTITWLADLLKENGHTIGKTVVSDHVRKVCACESGQ